MNKLVQRPAKFQRDMAEAVVTAIILAKAYNEVTFLLTLIERLNAIVKHCYGDHSRLIQSPCRAKARELGQPNVPRAIANNSAVTEGG